MYITMIISHEVNKMIPFCVYVKIFARTDMILTSKSYSYKHLSLEDGNRVTLFLCIVFYKVVDNS